jgi:hypothetical protein
VCIQFDAIHPVVYIDLHKRHYVLSLTHPVFIVVVVVVVAVAVVVIIIIIILILISNTTCFDQADHHQMFVYTET